MAKAKAENEDKGGIHKALTHPVRSAILLAIQTEGYSSPKRFSASTKGEVNLNVAAYHFRVLGKYGAIELLDTFQRRGATEHVYGLDPRSPVLDSLRATLLLQSIMTKGGGLDSGLSLNGGPNNIAIMPVEVDDEGRSEVAQVMAAVRESLAQVADSCRQRLEGSEQASISMRVGIATYSPTDGTASPPVSA
jgi:hypothetical protein